MGVEIYKGKPITLFESISAYKDEGFIALPL